MHLVLKFKLFNQGLLDTVPVYGIGHVHRATISKNYLGM